jgi:type II restriction enzyme
MAKKLFNFVIGNPPYNDDFENSGENGNYAKPVYNQFMDAVYKIADKVELIHPARFLFNAGSTPKVWNEKMLNDEHFKVLKYEPNSTAVFPNTDIKGGVAVTYHDGFKAFGPIGTFTAFSELNGIVKKARAVNENKSIASIIYTQVKFDLDTLYADYPEYENILGSRGKDRRFRNNIFEKVNLFTDERKGEDDLRILGILKNKRTWKYIPRKYVDMSHKNLKMWKVLVPRANGSGALGEVLSTPLIGKPLIGYTQSFIGIGSFHTEFEANALLQYVKSKFARTLLGVLKITQDNDSGVWTMIPLQDFTSSSDIDWSKSVHEIDLQLYRKYGLDEREINFIESHVKEMA